MALQKVYVKEKVKWQKLIEKNYKSNYIVKVQKIENGVILPPKKNGEGIYRGGVIDSDGKFVSGMLRNGSDNIKNPGYYGISEGYKIDSETIEVVDEKVIFGGVLIGHFGHMILECFSRMWYYLETKSDLKIAFIVILERKAWFDQFFKLLGLDLDQIIYINKPTQFQTIIVPDEAVHSWFDYTEKYLLPYHVMCKNLPTVEKKMPDKIYLTRSMLNKYGLTDCVNEKYFEDFYRNLGFTIIAPETLSIEEQIRLLYNAKEVVTTMGSISHLILFCRPHTKVTILCKVDDDTLLPQCLINQAKEVECSIVDVSFNFLHSNRSYGIVYLGPTEQWKKYVDDNYSIKISDNELENNCYEYIKNWIKYYIEPKNFLRIRTLTAFDFLRKMAKVFLDEDLKSENYLVEDNKNCIIPNIIHRCHRKKDGWGKETYSTEAIEKTENRNLNNIEAISIKVKGILNPICYSVYVQDIGWQNIVTTGEVAGTTGKGLPILGIWCWLDRNLQSDYDIIYRVKYDNNWGTWCKNGEATKIISGQLIYDIQFKLIRIF